MNPESVNMDPEGSNRRLILHELCLSRSLYSTEVTAEDEY